MAALHELPNRQAFGPFEVDTAAGELLKGGIRVRLPRQPFAILIILLKNAGEVVTRDQFRDQIWSEGTFVNFEQGLNTAMNKLRTALGDPAEKPRYIETRPGRGYRFIGILAPRLGCGLPPCLCGGVTNALRNDTVARPEAHPDHQRGRSFGQSGAIERWQ